jgi:hypothetical protein
LLQASRCTQTNSSVWRGCRCTGACQHEQAAASDGPLPLVAAQGPLGRGALGRAWRHLLTPTLHDNMCESVELIATVRWQQWASDRLFGTNNCVADGTPGCCALHVCDTCSLVSTHIGGTGQHHVRVQMGQHDGPAISRHQVNRCVWVVRMRVHMCTY